MNAFVQRTVRTASACALAAYLIGGFHAVREVWPRTWVLEFQAGRASTVAEKLGAINQSMALEACGFLAVGLVLSLLASALARLVPRWRTDEEGSGYGAALILCAGAFFGWVDLAWIADDALPFLTRPQILLLDLVGCALLLAGLACFDAVARRLPWTPRASEPSALASVACCWVATNYALKIVKSGEGGWRDPALIAMAGVLFLLALPLASGAARLIAWPVARLSTRLGSRPLVPWKASLALGTLLVVSVLVAANQFQLSPPRDEPAYSTLPDRGPNAGPNVVFVTMDTLRADHLSCYGYPRPTSPFLDSIAAEGALCADVTAAASWTKPATGTLLTGLHPSRHGALYHGSLLHLPAGELALAEAFRNRGYVTAGFVANPNLKRVFEFDRGFDVYFDSPVEDTVTLACIRGTHFGRMLMRLLRHQFNWNYENDITRMNQEVLPWLEKNHRRPFFLYAHYIDPHIPYDPPERYREEFAQDHGLVLFNERKERVGLDLYDGEIRYADDGVQELVQALQRHGVWEKTLFVFTSDHGEEFFEHGVLGHGFSLYQEVVHVPLIFRGPGVPAGKVVADPLQTVDLAATVLALAGAEERDFGDGRSFEHLFQADEPAAEGPYFMESEFGQDDSNHREFVFSGVRSGPWKLVLTEENEFFPPGDPRYGREALYHLGQDPSESRNLFHELDHRPRIEDLLRRLQTHAQFLQEQGFRDVAPAALTPEIAAGLKALGYIGEE